MVIINTVSRGKKISKNKGTSSVEAIHIFSGVSIRSYIDPGFFNAVRFPI